MAGGIFASPRFRLVKLVLSPVTCACRRAKIPCKPTSVALVATVAVASADIFTLAASNATSSFNAAVSAAIAVGEKVRKDALTAFVSLFKAAILGFSCLMALFRLLTPLLPFAPFMLFNTVAIDCPL